jgi:signal transduction histidine kinase
MNGHGLGLISIRERAGLVKGTVEVTSKPMGGTQITVRVPLASPKGASEMTFGAA